MDRFVPDRHHCDEMSRHLRIVADSTDDAAYVVGRSIHVRPGSPYVIARCVDRVVAAVFALAGQQVKTREEMERTPALAEALKAWDAGDDSLFRMERRARSAFGRPDRKEIIREVQWHPSRVSKSLP
jgi:hypothetical protein